MSQTINTDTPAKLWSVQEVSEYLGVPVGTIYQWRVRSEGPPAMRLGKHLRFDPESVARWAHGLEESAMAAVTRDSRDGHWLARWRDPTGRQRKKSSARKVDAQRWLDQMQTHYTRAVPFPPSLLEPIRSLCAGKEPEDLVFTSPEGWPLRLNNWRRRVFDPACKELGLKVSPHDLRHTAASLAIQRGANVKAVQRMLGHASAAMTLDVYAGLFSDDLDSVAVALDPLVPQMCHNGYALWSN